MTLGERIAAHRKAKSFSQEDLANILDVSRQAVYKWESDQSTPELEKLIALSSIFEISLDELVKGEKPTADPKTEPEAVEQAGKALPKRDRHFTAGIVFWACGIVLIFIMTFLSGSLWGAMIGVPFIICGFLCFLTRRHTRLWCGWTLYLSADLYMRFSTAIKPSDILYSFQWTEEMNYARLAFAWIQFTLVLLAIAVTVKTLGMLHIPVPERNRRNYILLGAGVLALPLLCVFNLSGMIWQLIYPQPSYELLFSVSYRFWSVASMEAYSVLLIAIAVFTVRMGIGLLKGKNPSAA